MYNQNLINERQKQLELEYNKITQDPREKFDINERFDKQQDVPAMYEMQRKHQLETRQKFMDEAKKVNLLTRQGDMEYHGGSLDQQQNSRMLDFNSQYGPLPPIQQEKRKIDLDYDLEGTGKRMIDLGQEGDNYQQSRMDFNSTPIKMNDIGLRGNNQTNIIDYTANPDFGNSYAPNPDFGRSESKFETVRFDDDNSRNYGRGPNMYNDTSQNNISKENNRRKIFVDDNQQQEDYPNSGREVRNMSYDFYNNTDNSLSRSQGWGNQFHSNLSQKPEQQNLGQSGMLGKKGGDDDDVPEVFRREPGARNLQESRRF